LTREEFARKKSQLKDRQYEINELLDSYDKVDDKFSKKLVDLISITNNAYETFKGSTIAEKREFLNFIFANLSLKGCKVHYSLVFPFTELKNLANCSEWRGAWHGLRTLRRFRLDVITINIKQYDLGQRTA
jgi:hypothetical protein